MYAVAVKLPGDCKIVESSENQAYGEDNHVMIKVGGDMENIRSSIIDTLYPDFHFPLRNNVKISEHAPNFNVFKPRLVCRRILILPSGSSGKKFQFFSTI